MSPLGACALRAFIYALLILTNACAFGGTVLLIAKSDGGSSFQTKMLAVSRFYGLDLKIVSVTSQAGRKKLLHSVRSSGTVAVVITADALSHLNAKLVLAALQDRPKAIPVLIGAIDDVTQVEALDKWSDGKILGVKRMNDLTAANYSVSHSSAITGSLAGSVFPLQITTVPYLVLSNGEVVDQLLGVRVKNVEFPVFARLRRGRQEVFLATDVPTKEPALAADPYRQIAVFADVIIPMIFLRYAAADRAWHTPAAFANLTIDDVWLREPYGHVEYKRLLEQATLHNFHVTMAFIPWNFDRSQAEVVALFREHSDKLSVAVHGNNHVHQEFGPVEDHPLDKQALNVKQGLMRMERFRELTGLSFDKVMIFPHSISPSATLSLLRDSNYLMTVNSLSVPSDASVPSGLEFSLRTGSLAFENFPSLRRYSAETNIPRTQLAIDEFLGNPALFYVHQNFFAPGPQAFNAVAESVAELNSKAKWTDLGVIARHLYLERLRDDGDIDVQAISPVISLENNLSRAVLYHVTRQEDFTRPLRVLFNASPLEFRRTKSQVLVDILLPSESRAEITMEYSNEEVGSKISPVETSIYVSTIRLLSDFRDNTVSRSKLGRLFSASYGNHARSWNRLFEFAVTASSIVFACTYLVRKSRYRKRAYHQVAP